MQVQIRSTKSRAGRARAAFGFTLIEMMVVVAVVAILAAIAFPSYQDSVRKGRRGQAKADLVELAQRAERFHTVNNTYAGFEATLPASALQSPQSGVARYTLDVTVETPVTFTITAAPQGAQAADRCGMLSLTAAGAKTASGGPQEECF